MISQARTLSFKLLCQIESRGVFSDDALNSREVGRLEVRDRHLTTEIVYGTLRWQAALDFVLSGLSSRRWEDVTPGARILLRMSLYQMWQMDRMPDHAIVNDAVELAKRELGKGIDRYSNGILRHLTRTRPWESKEFLREAPAWARVSLPQWLWERWSERYGDPDAVEFALALNRPPAAGFLCSEIQEKAVGSPSEYVPSDLVPGACIRIGSGRNPDGGEGVPAAVHAQDEASQLIPHLLGPACHGWKVWDSCAAPGGKARILGMLCGDSGHVTAGDVRWDRVRRMAGFLRDSGQRGIDAIVADASRQPPFRARFDAVLADVPCSGLGTLRRNPEIKWRFKPESFPSLQQTQKEIIRSVSESVRPGGRLLYSTCSTEPEENEQVVLSFLETHANFTLVRPGHPPGIEKWICPDAMVRTFPGTRLWDGFFAALLVRY